MNENRQFFCRNLQAALLTGLGYLVIYLLGRVIWCRSPDLSVMGWLFDANPSGRNSLRTRALRLGNPLHRIYPVGVCRHFAGMASALTRISKQPPRPSKAEGAVLFACVYCFRKFRTVSICAVTLSMEGPPLTLRSATQVSSETA